MMRIAGLPTTAPECPVPPGAESAAPNAAAIAAACIATRDGFMPATFDDGECATFAFALVDALAACGIASQVLVGVRNFLMLERESCSWDDAEGDGGEEEPAGGPAGEPAGEPARILSHCVVALVAGGQPVFDADGGNADEAWEQIFHDHDNEDEQTLSFDWMPAESEARFAELAAGLCADTAIDPDLKMKVAARLREELAWRLA